MASGNSSFSRPRLRWGQRRGRNAPRFRWECHWCGSKRGLTESLRPDRTLPYGLVKIAVCKDRIGCLCRLLQQTNPLGNKPVEPALEERLAA